ncbi:DUF4160 domain-containing protein [Pararhizobium sp.]|uniref:DUF4160 domain-containing protein n=1 Tax=Pararhizobium sp. TaxID=1977563 RepID=UPI0027214429|nr:DUF4160 domain-containing protein [Pararhizobium sp.]MDO9415787.1 DUF4160 domain-containing protein [Pararhizobium sp.]
MPTIKRNVHIRMFANDHNPPHFHVVTTDHQAVVSLASLELIQGTMDAGSLRTAVDWATDHLKDLEREWSRLNEQ